MGSYDQQNQHAESQVNVGENLNVGQDFVARDKHEHHHHYPQTTATGKPLQRPPRDRHFLGRDDALAQLLRDLQPGKIVTLCGPGGIGKSALAAEALWRLAPGKDAPQAFPDGIFFHGFYNQPSADIALEAIARAYGEEPKPTVEAAARRALSGRCALLVLDGAEAADDLRKVWAVAGGCGVLITSCKTDDAPDTWQDIPLLTEDAAVALLRAWAEVADEAVAREICRLAGGLPLAVRLVGFYLSRRRQKPETYLEWMRASPLAALDHGTHRQDSMPLLLERSLEQVSAAARQALALSGWLAIAPFEPAIIAAALDVPAYQAEALLGELLGFGLLQDADGAYRITHALIHGYARAKLAVPQPATARLFAWYLDFATTESANGAEGYRRLDAQRAHLLYLIDGCMQRESSLKAIIIQLIQPVSHYLDDQGYWRESQKMLHVGIDATRILNDKVAEAVFLNSLGMIYHNIGQPDDAISCYEKSLSIDRKISNTNGIGAILGNLGLIYSDLGEHEKAVKFYQDALNIARKIEDEYVESSQLGNLGLAYQRLAYEYRDIEYINKAIAYHKEALSIARKIKNKYIEGSQLGNLGSAYETLGLANHDPKLITDAVEYYKQSMDIMQDNKKSQVTGLGSLGCAYFKLEHYEKSAEYYWEQLLLSYKIGDPYGHGNACWGLAMCFEAEGNILLAIVFVEMAVDIFTKIQSPHTERMRQWLEKLTLTIDPLQLDGSM